MADAEKFAYFRTSISPEKTVAEIQRLLVQHKAQAVLSEYDDTSVLTHLSF